MNSLNHLSVLTVAISLTLTTSAFTSNLNAEEPDPQIAKLLQGSWVVEKIGDRTLTKQPRPTLIVNPKNEIYGDTSINRYGGQLNPKGTPLLFGPMRSTLRAGTEEFMELENQWKSVLQKASQVKRDKDRLDIAKMTSTDTVGSALTGGYIIEMNINGAPAAWNSAYPPINNATSPHAVEFKYVYPKADSILPVQGNYIKTFVDSFENALSGVNFTNDSLGYRAWIDVSTFIDFLIVNEFSMNYDSYGRSTYMYKEKDTDGGKLCIGPPWDYDRALANDPQSNRHDPEEPRPTSHLACRKTRLDQ